MDVTQYLRQLEAVGFREELLDRAMALGGASRLVYDALYQAVIRQGLSPEEAIRRIEYDKR